MLVILAGCSTAPPRARNQYVSDWEAPGLTKSTPPTPTTPALAQTAPLPPAAPPTNQIAETWVSLNRWAESNNFGVCLRLSANSPLFAFTTSSGVMVLEAGSRLAHWDGLALQLGFAPRTVNDELLVHALDLRKNFLPLIAPPLMASPAHPVLVIDSGHGGADTGAKNVFNGHFEKEYTLDWARRLQRLLSAQGWEVLLTRTNDTGVPLSERVAFAERHRATLFLSLHFNSTFPSRTQAGLETYCLTPAGMPSNLTRGYDDDLALVFPNNAFDRENLQCAVRLHQALLEANGNSDRGVRRARFLGVLRGQNRPAVLLEGGYLSNLNEARQIAEPTHRQKLAEAVAQALIQKSKAGSRKPEAGLLPSSLRLLNSPASTTNVLLR